MDLMLGASSFRRRMCLYTVNQVSDPHFRQARYELEVQRGH